MKNGWIKIEEELPELNDEVIMAYSNCAYNSMWFVVLGKRINDDHVIVGSTGLLLPLKQKPHGPSSYVTCWAHNNGQDLNNPCPWQNTKEKIDVKHFESLKGTVGTKNEINYTYPRINKYYGGQK